MDTGDGATGGVDNAEAEAAGAAGGFARKLNRLIDASRPKDERPLSTRTLAREVTARGTPVSPSFIALLRSGQRDNPTVKVVQALADYFQVPAGYFFDSAVAEQIDSQLELLMALRDGHIRTVATRMPELQPSTRRWLAEQMTEFKRMGRPEVQDDRTSGPDPTP